MIPDITGDFFKWENHLPIKIIPLDQEVSTRKYFKVIYPHVSVILCQDSIINQNFIELSGFYAIHSVPVPKVLNQNNSLILQTFCGEKDLSTVRDDSEYFNYLQKAIDIIQSIQRLLPINIIQAKKFDFEKFMFELNFTNKHLLSFAERYAKNLAMPEKVYDYMKGLAISLSTEREMVICHRDFHSRNLLLKDDSSLCMIDYQDSMMGLREYDLVSLLFDSYRPITESMRKDAIEYFCQNFKGQRENFTEEFYLIAMQRAVKVLGSYLMVIGERKIEKFRESLKNCLNHLLLISKESYFDSFIYEYFFHLQQSFTKYRIF